MLNVNSYIYYNKNIYIVDKILNNDILLINLENNKLIVISKQDNYKILNINSPVELRKLYISIKKLN